MFDFGVDTRLPGNALDKCIVSGNVTAGNHQNENEEMNIQ
jgi:hypothetical protein